MRSICTENAAAKTNKSRGTLRSIQDPQKTSETEVRAQYCNLNFDYVDCAKNPRGNNVNDKIYNNI